MGLCLYQKQLLDTGKIEAPRVLLGAGGLLLVQGIEDRARLPRGTLCPSFATRPLGPDPLA